MSQSFAERLQQQHQEHVENAASQLDKVFEGLIKFTNANNDIIESFALSQADQESFIVAGVSKKLNTPEKGIMLGGVIHHVEESARLCTHCTEKSLFVENWCTCDAEDSHKWYWLCRMLLGDSRARLVFARTMKLLLGLRVEIIPLSNVDGFNFVAHFTR